MKASVSLICAVCFVFCFSSCDRQEQAHEKKADSAASTKNAVFSQDSRQRSEPAQLAQLSGYETIDTPQELLGRLAPADRAIVQDFYGRYDPAILDFMRHDQLEWMVENDYPMPEDIVAASRLTDQELLDMHEKGAVKAGFIYLDRQIETAVQDLQPGEYVPSKKRSELYPVARDLLLSGSPFAGYALAKYEADVNHDPNAALASYAWAAWRGDGRAMEAMARAQVRLARADIRNSIDPATSVLAFSNMLGTVRGLKPGLLAQTIKKPMPSDFDPPAPP